MAWRIEKRAAARAPASRWAFPIAFGFAIVVGAGIFAALGANPLTAYGVMLKGAFGSFFHFSEVIVRAIPLMLTGLAVALAATMLLWNIGCEGQLVWGGIAAAAVGLFAAPHLPEALVLPAVILAGAAGGALWALIPALLKAYLAVNEILSSLLLNYIAIIFMEHLYFGPWRNPEGFGFPGTAQIHDLAEHFEAPYHTVHLWTLICLALGILGENEREYLGADLAAVGL